jgi:hypothetical protein
MMSSSAEAQAFLAGLEAAANAQAAEEFPSTAAAGTSSYEKASAAPVEQINGQTNAHQQQGTPAPNDSLGSRKKRNRWGPTPVEATSQGGGGESKPVKKRRSRWEDVPEPNTDTTLALVPKEIVIAGNIKVCINSKHVSQARLAL